MSLETQELRKIFSELQSEFFNNNEIQVHPVSGDPPSQYEVTYDIPCTTQDERGSVSITSGHTVTISIPFGFPHFPPSCKPKSSIFHPDFDSAAICLGDFWNRERTISDLILHIGSMLRGDVYSVENAFNEEAATWFRENNDQLPFAESTEPAASAIPLKAVDPEEFLEIEESEDIPEIEKEFHLSLEPTEDEPEISTMEDLDFMDDFQFPANFPEAPSSKTPSSKPAKAKIDSDRLKQLAEKRNFNQLDKELSTLAKDADFPEKRSLTDRTASTLKEARKLYDDAENFENQGLSNKALERFKAVEDLVADFPDIRADISRTEQASDLLRDITGSSDDSPSKPIKKNNKEKKLPPPLPRQHNPTEEKSGAYEQSTKRSLNIIPYVLTGGILCILAPLTYYYFTLSGQLTEARQLFSECTSSYAEKNFQAAEKACSTSLETTKGIFLIHQTDVSELQSGIRNILDSEEMQQGLQGNVLYNERYVSKSALSAHQSLQDMLSQGKTFLETSAWDQAAASFQKALELCRQLEGLSPDEQINIEQNLNYAAFRSMLKTAESQVDKEDWQVAAATLSELQGQINKLSPRQQVEYRDYVETLLAKSRFTSLKEQANTLFSQSDWTGAASLFQKAVEAGRALSEKESQDLTGLKANITRAELYSTINAGNSAFAAGKWDMAIGKYTLAIGILNANSDLLNIQEIEQSRQKLDRIILQSAIIRDRQTAEKSKDAADMTKTLSHLQKVIDTIQGSDFADDPEFKEIVSETRQAQQKIREEMYIKDKEQYLVSNFKTLFIENYPAATPETLSAPVVTLEKRLGKLYLFKLQCTESGRGRPLKLIMFYTYDPDSRRWKFYSGS